MTVYNNPTVLQRVDPWALKVDGECWFTASDPEYNKIAIRHASAINGPQKAPEIVVWRKCKSDVRSKYTWAPELHRVGGTQYIYFAGAEHEFKSNDMPTYRMFVLGNTDASPTIDNWAEKGQIVTPMGSLSFNTAIKVIDGVQYLIWTQKDYGIPDDSNLYIAPMVSPWTLAASPVMLTEPEYDRERTDFLVNEGPIFLLHDDKIFITYSASGIGVPYAVGLLAADRGSSLMDPKSWTKSPVPVFKTCSESDQYDPGYNLFTKSGDDLEDLMIYHACNYTKVKSDPPLDPSRHARVGVMRWDEDGTPGSGVPEPDNL